MRAKVAPCGDCIWNAERALTASDRVCTSAHLCCEPQYLRHITADPFEVFVSLPGGAPWLGMEHAEIIRRER